MSSSAGSSEKERAIEELSLTLSALLLTFSWHYLGIKNATETRLIALSTQGFTVVTKYGNKERTDMYLFLTSDREAADTRAGELRGSRKHKGVTTNGSVVFNMLIAVLNRYSYAHWPPYGMASIFFWLIGLVAALPLTDLFAQYSFLSFAASLLPTLLAAKSFLVRFLFQTEHYALIYVIAQMGIHALETMYALHLLHDVPLPFRARLSWTIYCTILGYPITSRAMRLDKTHLAALTKLKHH